MITETPLPEHDCQHSDMQQSKTYLLYIETINLKWLWCYLFM